MAALGSIATLVVWLLVDHELWERRSGPAARGGQPIGLYDAATVATLTLGVVCPYGALLVPNFLAAEVFVVDEVLRRRCGIRSPRTPTSSPPRPADLIVLVVRGPDVDAVAVRS